MSNKLFIVSGPSGSGKTTIARSVMSNEITSFTTRPMRPGEVDGVDYIFITDEEFDHLYNNNGLAEYTDYYGTAKYGITMYELVTKLEKGDAFVVVDVVGKEQLEKLYDNTVSVFIFMPFTENAAQRMRGRGDSEERIAQRLKTYEEEVENFPQYDLLLDNNGKIEDAIEGFRMIVSGEYDS